MNNPESRIACRDCPAMIRIVNAKYQNDRCISCDREFRNREQEKLKNELRKNPPKSQEDIERIVSDFHHPNHLAIASFLNSIRPPLVDPRNFDENEFVTALKTALQRYRGCPQKFGIEFHHLCEPFENSNGGMFKGIMKIPQPYCSVYAVFIAHGNVGLGSFEQALANIDKRLDLEIERGLKLLGCHQAAGIFKTARRKLRFRLDGHLPDDLDEELANRFLSALGEYNFTERILVPFLEDHFA